MGSKRMLAQENLTVDFKIDLFLRHVMTSWLAK